MSPCCQGVQYKTQILCDCVLQVNASLANDIGNLLNRTLGLLAKNCGGVLPIAAADITQSHPLRSLVPDQVRPHIWQPK
jgi:methionyl-tRNA synthetase